MKNRNFFKNSIRLLLPSSLVLGVFFGIPRKVTYEAKAYTASSLPTTIYLDPTGDSVIRNYYATVSGKKGNDLLKALKPVLMNNQKYYSYDSSDDSIWKMYEIIDRDWDKSPANAIKSGTYDSSKNVITNYKYKNISVEDPYVRALYVNRDADNPKTAWAAHTPRSDVRTIEREHIWPKSHGFNSGTAAGARGDPMHLWAADGTANGMHSNLFYGYVDTTKSYKDAGNSHNILWGNLTGTSKTIGTGTVFEPQDSDKGDIARACFYMVARYNNLALNDNNISGANPNLTLSTNLNENDRTGTSTSTDAFSLGLLQDLLEWNKIDPVDAFEIKRNDLLYRNFTNNRNPFIDFPEWADIIWGNAAGSANPATDSLNGGTVVPTTKTLKSIAVTTQPNKTTYTAGENFSSAGMVVTAYYSDNTSEVISDYTISKTSSLTVADKLITVSYQGKTATVTITVNASSGGETTYTWEKVTSTSELAKDSIYTFANEAKGRVALLMDTQKYFQTSTDASNADFSNGVMTPKDGVAPVELTLGGDTSAWTFTDSQGLVGATAAKALTHNPSGSSACTTFTISFDTDENAVITFTNNNLGRIYYNSGSPRFLNYTSNQAEIQLYKKVAHGGSVVHPTGVTLNSATKTIEKGYQETLIATVLPENVSDNSVDWSSNNENVATVDEFGVVTAISPGTAVITATAHDATGGYGASCTVTVPEPIILSSLTISGDYKTSYYIGDSFSTDGIVITAHYTQGGAEVKTEDVTSQCEFEGFESETAGTKPITVIFDEYSDVLFNVVVSEIPVEENTVKFITSQYGLDNGQSAGTITKDNFEVVFNNTGSKYYDYGSAIRVYGGNSFTISGPKKIISVSFVFADQSQTNTFTVDKGTCNALTGAWSSQTGEASLTFSLTSGSGHRKIQQIIVKYDPEQSSYAPLISIELSGKYKQDFTQSDVFSYENLIVTANYEDSTSKVVTPTNVEGADFSKTGAQEITVYYTEGQITKTAKYMIFVRESSEKTLTKTMSEVVSENEYILSAGNDIGTKTTGFTLNNDISVVLDKTENAQGNTGSFWGASPNTDMRLYKNDIPQLTISSNEGCEIATVQIIYSISNNGTLLHNSNVVASNQEIEVNDSSITFGVGVTSGSKNGQVRITSISLTYRSAGVSLTGISLGGDYKTEFVINDEFSTEGLVVNAVYSDNSKVDVTAAAKISSVDTSVLGEKTVSIGFDKYSTSYKINIVEQPVLKDYTLSGGKLLEGKYVIASFVSDNSYNFMKAAITNNKFGFKQLNTTDGKVTIDQSLFEWTIEANGSYYTFYNEKTESYAASSGLDNQGALQKTIDDKALWSITRTAGTDTYQIINKYNETNNIHSVLQCYQSAGFGTYSFNKSLSLFRLDNTSFVKVINSKQIVDGSKITLTASRTVDKVQKTFGLGENIRDKSYIDGIELNWNIFDIYGFQNNEVNIFEVEVHGEYFALKTKDGKYLYSNSTNVPINLSDSFKNESNEYLFTTEVVNGNVAIKCVGTNRYLGYNYGTGNVHFGFYVSPNVSIYVDRNSGEANAWSAEFLKGTEGCIADNLELYEEEFSNLSYASRSAIISATGNQNGSLIEQAMARYDYMLARGDIDQANNFISERGVAGYRPVLIGSILLGNDNTLLIAIISLVGVSIIGGYFFVKRRKNEEL